VELSDSGSGNITRIDNALNGIETKINDEQETLAMTRANLETINAQINKPFDKADELRSMKKELDEINKELGIGEEDISNVLDEIPVVEAFTEDALFWEQEEELEV
jgi:predicted  nucleic acid-binding Zn-ribbon protein